MLRKNKDENTIKKDEIAYTELIKQIDEGNVTKIKMTVGSTTVKVTLKDEEKPKITSGIRIGTPAITSRGFDTNEAIKIVHLIDKALKNKDNNVLMDVKKEVIELTKKHPLPL